ncbi:MAG: hypothetical protein L0K67_12260, partial [Brevibacterium sp.]|nr:hypothetical protein [Brevibacterium sp.]
YGASNDVKSATQVVPANPMPTDVPFSGKEPAGASSAGSSTSAAPNDGAGDGKLRIDLAGSSVTVFVMTKK